MSLKPAGAPRGKRPRIRITCVDQLGECRCHHGHKPGDVFDFDRDRGKLCPMACHVGFPYIDILRYGGTVPGNEAGTAKFCCPRSIPSTSFWPRSWSSSGPSVPIGREEISTRAEPSHCKKSSLERWQKF